MPNENRPHMLPVVNENAAKLQDVAQVAQAGESARDTALQLERIHKREAVQRERMAAKFANRPKTQPSADFDLPLAN